jgi:branched-chain amino acid transport system substrate-binding protein
MKTKLWFKLFVSAVIAAMIGFVGTADSAAKDKIVIGQAIALSGPLAGGVEIAGGKIYELWVEEVNKNGGIYVKEYGKKLPVELKRYDDKSDIGTMTNLLEKLILEDKVDFVFPPWGTAWLFAAAPIANKYGYILIGGPGGALKLKELSLPYFFQVLHGVEYGEAFVPDFKKRKIDVKMVKSYPDGIKDLSPLIKEAKAANVDGFVSACYPPGGMLLTGQLLELGINFNALFLTVLPFSPNVYRDNFGTNVVEGVMGGGAWNAKSGPGAKDLVDKFKARFGVEPDYWGGLYYWSSLQHFQQAIEKAGTLDQKKIRDVMAKEKFDTALGPFWYDENRYFVNHPGEIGQWQKGVFEVIDPGKKRTAPPEYPKPEWPKKQ